jgi:hypothetical protein
MSDTGPRTRGETIAEATALVRGLVAETTRAAALQPDRIGIG